MFRELTASNSAPANSDALLSLLVGHNEDRRLVVLEVYVDESGTHGGSKLLVAAAWSATAEEWRLFNSEADASLVRQQLDEALLEDVEVIAEIDASVRWQ